MDTRLYTTVASERQQAARQRADLHRRRHTTPTSPAAWATARPAARPRPGGPTLADTRSDHRLAA